MGSKGGAVVRASASHQCGQGSIASVVATRILLLALSNAPMRFFSGYSSFLLSSKNQHCQIPIGSGTHGHVLSEFLRTPKCFVSKQITIYNFYCAQTRFSEDRP